MAIIIGQNASTLANRAALDTAAGLRIAAVMASLRDASELKLLLDQLADADLKAMNYQDGTNGTPNEIGYLRSALADAADLYAVMNGTASQRAAGYNYAQSLRYVAALS